MRCHFYPVVLELLCLIASSTVGGEYKQTTLSPYAAWKNSPLADSNYFPIAIWLQDPRNAERYRAAGINIYVGLWRGPTTEQLVELEKARVNLICSQNPAALSNRNNSVIIGWMHGDEPDNAQAMKSSKGYGPPILPEKIIEGYEKIRAADPTRPVLLNLGQGVAWDNYVGRGVRRNHPEDYSEYLKGCDIASFDIYPVVHENKEIAGKLEYVPRGVERLIQWSGGEKTIWNCIECTHIGNPESKASPAQVRSEVWMSLIHGSRGLIYFVHQFQPNFREAALLDDPEMLTAVTAINNRIRLLAPVLNSSAPVPKVGLESSLPTVPIDWTARHFKDSTYIFAAAMRDQPTDGVFKIGGLAKQVEVLDESRTVSIQNGEFSDHFKPYEVHLYRIAPKDWCPTKAELFLRLRMQVEAWKAAPRIDLGGGLKGSTLLEKRHEGA